MKIKIFAAALSLVALSADANAADICNDRSDGQNGVDCRQAVFEKVESDLKKALVALRARVRSADKDAGIDHGAVLKTLEITQRAWQQFVDGDCRAQRQFVGSGTSKNDVELSCLAEHYRIRLQQVRRWGET